MATEHLHPVNDDLLRHNRRIIASRIGWPDGAVEACDKLQDAYPDWIPGWQPASTIPGFEHPAGYFASRHSRRHDEPPAYGADPLELAAAIEGWPWQNAMDYRGRSWMSTGRPANGRS